MKSRFLWTVRREFWENRFLWIAPVVVSAIVLLASAVNLARAARAGRSLLMPLLTAPAPIMFSTLLVGFFYCLDALYGERRDRSILFWKSLPVSDRTTVLAKLCVPMAALPLLAYVLSAAAQLILLLFSTPILAANDASALQVWSELGFASGLIVMIYGLTVHAFWFAPIYGWFLLVSAWAKRTPLLWAVLPLFTIAAVERVLFGTSLFPAMLGYRFTGAMSRAFVAGGDKNGFSLSELTPLKFLSTPGLWLGLIFAALCVAAAVRLRRLREPI